MNRSHLKTARQAEDELRHAPGVGPRLEGGRKRLSGLEWITLAHLGIFALAATWAFGGMADVVRAPLATWGSLGVFITIAALTRTETWRDGWARPLRWAWPILAFNVVVVLAGLNPGFREIIVDHDTLLVRNRASSWWPSSARPTLAYEALWVFDAIWLACFNLVLVVRQRRALRILLVIVCVNAALLALFGTLQKIAPSRGLFFDAVPSPQRFFFASFVYHNHWGAFALLMLAAGLGLAWHFGRRKDIRDVMHSPIFGGVLALLLIGATVPLSGSRSGTLLLLVLAGGLVFHLFRQQIRRRRRLDESIAKPVLAVAAVIGLSAAAIWFVARDSILSRLDKTQEQVATMKAEGTIGDRALLYGNTLRMARDRPWFGWGMASYPHVFTLYNTRESKLDRLPVFYHDAHSDWLQALAEHGMVGSALLALAAVLPVRRVRARHLTSPLPTYLLGGCALVVVYALVEFPFGNFAVVLTWWLCFFAAVQYMRLQDREAPAPPSGAPGTGRGSL